MTHGHSSHAVLPTLLLIGAALLASVPVAAASHQSCSGATPLPPSGAITGVVAQGDSDWYVHPVSGSATYVLQPLPLDVDLRVFDGCGVFLCLASASLSVPDRCDVNGAGPFHIEVYGYTGGPYALTFTTNSPFVAPPSPAVQSNPDGTCTVYDDRNGNGYPDSGEQIATAPCSAKDTPFTVPAQSVSQGLPGLSSPQVPPTTVTTPPVTTPATCTVSVCTSSTTVPALYTPPVSQVCTPLGLVCVGPVAPQPLTPSVTVPAVCTAASFVCVPPTTLVPSQSATVPGVAPIALTPPVTVSVSSTTFNGLVEPNVGEFVFVGPYSVMVGPVPVTVCATPCPVPVAPDVDLVGTITVSATVGGTTYTQSVPVNA